MSQNQHHFHQHEHRTNFGLGWVLLGFVLFFVFWAVVVLFVAYPWLLLSLALVIGGGITAVALIRDHRRQSVVPLVLTPHEENCIRIYRAEKDRS